MMNGKQRPPWSGYDATAQGSPPRTGLMTPTQAQRLDQLWTPPHARYYRGSNQAGLVSAAYNTVLYNTLDFQSSPAPFTLASGVFTVVAGYEGLYRVEARVRLTGVVAAAAYARLELTVGGAARDLDEVHSSGGNELTLQCRTLARFSAGTAASASLVPYPATVPTILGAPITYISFEFVGS